MPSSHKDFSFPSQTNSLLYKPANFSSQQQKPESQEDFSAFYSTRKLHTDENECHGDHKSEEVSSQGLVVFPIALREELQSFEDVVLAQGLMGKKEKTFVISVYAQSFSLGDSEKKIWERLSEAQCEAQVNTAAHHSLYYRNRSRLCGRHGT